MAGAVYDVSMIMSPFLGGLIVSGGVGVAWWAGVGVLMIGAGVLVIGAGVLVIGGGSVNDRGREC